MDSEMLEGNRYPQKSLIPTPVIAVVLLLIVIPLVVVFISRNGTQNEAELFGAEQKANPMKNRRAEVDKALEDVDFEKNTYQIEFDTTLGKITLDLYPDVAPGHCKNIIGLSKIGFYDGLTFHRVIKDFMCQGGCPLGTGTGGPGYQIKAEFNDKKHMPGTLSMARSQSPDSAGSQFFICTARVAHLDNQYTVFGQTADDTSLANVLKFNSVKTGPGDKPLEPIKIKTAKVLVKAK